MDPGEIEPDALRSMLYLKDEIRTGWELRGVETPESVAGHSWGAAVLCLLFADEEGVDRDRCLELALVHDLAEAEVGDLPLRADREKEKQGWAPEEKEEMERAAMEEFAETLDAELLELWEAYEKRETREARFVKDMDLLDMCLQALHYETEERYNPSEGSFQEYEDMDAFFATAEPRLSTDTGRRLFDRIKKRYEEVK